MISKRSRKVMKVLMTAMDNGEEINVMELHKRLGENIAYGTVRSALRVLIRDGMIYFTRQGTNNYYKPTAKGFAFFRSPR